MIPQIRKSCKITLQSRKQLKVISSDREYQVKQYAIKIDSRKNINSLCLNHEQGHQIDDDF